MATTVELSPQQVDYLADHLGEYGSLAFAAMPGVTFRIAEPVGICPSCGEPAYNEDDPDGPVWTCPADLADGNPFREPAHIAITDELREMSGVFSNCGEDFGLPCHDMMPLHSECYERGGY